MLFRSTIPSLRFDGTDIDPAQIFLGNSTGLIAVPTIRFADVDGDGIDDVVANLSAEIVTGVRKLVATADDPITLYFRTKTGKGYEVSGLFAGGGPVAVVPPPIGDPARGNDSFLSQPGTGSTHTTRLGPTFPNPSRGSLTFTFELGRPGDARVEVYDLRGALIRTLMHGAIPAGRYDLAWDGRDDVGRLATNGLYLVHARAGDYRASRSLVLMRSSR